MHAVYVKVLYFSSVCVSVSSKGQCSTAKQIRKRVIGRIIRLCGSRWGIINFVLCKLCSGPWPGGGEVTQLQAAVSMLYNLCVIRAAPGKCQNWWPLIFLRIALDRRLQPRRYSANSDPASCAVSWTIYHPHTTLSTTFLTLFHHSWLQVILKVISC